MENTVIKGAGFHHLALYASDFDKTMDFYLKVLGCVSFRGWGDVKDLGPMVYFCCRSLLLFFAKVFLVEALIS